MGLWRRFPAKGGKSAFKQRSRHWPWAGSGGNNSVAPEGFAPHCRVADSLTRSGR